MAVLGNCLSDSLSLIANSLSDIIWHNVEEIIWKLSWHIIIKTLEDDSHYFCKAINCQIRKIHIKLHIQVPSAKTIGTVQDYTLDDDDGLETVQNGGIIFIFNDFSVSHIVSKNRRYNFHGWRSDFLFFLMHTFPVPLLFGLFVGLTWTSISRSSTTTKMLWIRLKHSWKMSYGLDFSCSIVGAKSYVPDHRRCPQD